MPEDVLASKKYGYNPSSYKSVCVWLYVWSLYLSLCAAVNVGGGGFEYSTVQAYPKVWHPRIQFCIIGLINMYHIYPVKIAHKIEYMPMLDKPDHVAGVYLLG